MLGLKNLQLLDVVRMLVWSLGNQNSGVVSKHTPLHQRVPEKLFKCEIRTVRLWNGIFFTNLTKSHIEPFLNTLSR